MDDLQRFQRFDIVRRLGEGGMGTVYEAIDSQIGRHVALKILRRELLTEHPELLERLWVEARAANGIRHPGVVEISEVGVTEDGGGFLVMQLLDGQTLTRRLVRAGGRLDLTTTLQIATQVASALAAGHKAGIVHRDLKPDNLMLVPDDAALAGERVKILDFGIAKLAPTQLPSGPLTLANSALGTPGYMAPEQLKDATLSSERSDVYGLAALIYRMLVGHPPHVAHSTAELIAAVMTREPLPIETYVTGLPASLCLLIGRMLRTSLEERPTMAEVLQILSSLGQQLSAAGGGGWDRKLIDSATIESMLPSMSSPLASAVVPGMAASPQTPPSASSISAVTGQAADSRRAKPKYRLLLVTMMLAGASLAGVVGILGFRSHSSPRGGQAQPDPGRGVHADLSVPVDLGVPAIDLADPPQVAPRRPEGDRGPDESNTKVVARPGDMDQQRTRRVQVAIHCVHPEGAKLSFAVRRIVAQSFTKADVLLRPSDSLELIRQGRQLIFYRPPAWISSDRATIQRLVNDALEPDDLPPELKRVRISCH